jgi:putative peptidoglycan lipid II flippase
MEPRGAPDLAPDDAATLISARRLHERRWRSAAETALRVARVLLPGGALVISVLTFGSYVMGLLRDRLLLQTFGAGAELDAYNAAFILPELTLRVVVASGLAAPFIPIFARLRRDDVRDAHAFAQTILSLAVAAMAAVSALLFAVAPLTVTLVAPGFGAAERELYTSLFRVMCLTPVIFAASIALGEVLVAERRFLSYAVAPILYNAGIVVGTVVLAGTLGIFAAAVGAVLGAAVHLGVRLAGAWRVGLCIRPRLALRTAAIREFFVLMLPKTGSSPLEPLTFLFFTNVASLLAAGSVAIVNTAVNFQALPVSLIGVAFSLAAFPALATAYAAGDRPAFVGTLVTNTFTIVALTVGAAVGLFLVGGLAVRILLGGGRFDEAAIARTSLVLSAFALSVPFDAIGHLLSRAIYATRHTLLQVLASLAGFAVMIPTTLALLPALDVIAIPLGYAAGSAVRVMLLAVVLVGRLRGFGAPAGPT